MLCSKVTNNIVYILFRLNFFRREKMITKRPLFLFGMIILSSGFFISDAYAYLDPGTGSMFITAIIGALVGLFITLKIYWYKLKEKIIGRSVKK